MKIQGYIPPRAEPGAHEGADLNARNIVRVGVVFAVSFAAILLGVLLLFHVFGDVYRGRTSEAAPVVLASDLPPQPRLQIDPSRELRATRAAEDRHLHDYGWVDRAGGVAQIPISRAMTLWVQSYAAAPAPETNGAPAAAPTTELEMRQQKAQEGNHAR
jgi:hypothetical protein